MSPRALFLMILGFLALPGWAAADAIETPLADSIFAQQQGTLLAEMTQTEALESDRTGRLSDASGELRKKSGRAKDRAAKRKAARAARTAKVKAVRESRLAGQRQGGGDGDKLRLKGELAEEISVHAAALDRVLPGEQETQAGSVALDASTPAPTALAGGLALLGMLAGRRRSTSAA